MSSYVCRRLETSSPRRRRAGAIAVRGLHFAIVDEADSVLIDEARTPLILSANVDAEGGATRFRRALDVVGGLLAGRDYRVSETEHRIEMTTAGRQRATSLIAAMEITSDDWIWRVPRASEELIVQALSARYLYRRDKHYIVTDGKVQILDEYTGLSTDVQSATQTIIAANPTKTSRAKITPMDLSRSYCWSQQTRRCAEFVAFSVSPHIKTISISGPGSHL